MLVEMTQAQAQVVRGAIDDRLCALTDRRGKLVRERFEITDFEAAVLAPKTGHHAEFVRLTDGIAAVEEEMLDLATARRAIIV